MKIGGYHIVIKGVARQDYLRAPGCLIVLTCCMKGKQKLQKIADRLGAVFKAFGGKSA